MTRGNNMPENQHVMTILTKDFNVRIKQSAKK